MMSERRKIMNEVVFTISRYEGDQIFLRTTNENFKTYNTIARERFLFKVMASLSSIINDMGYAVLFETE